LSTQTCGQAEIVINFVCCAQWTHKGRFPVNKVPRQGSV